MARLSPPPAVQFDLGQDLYQLRCSGCHGLGGEGLIGPSLVESVLPFADVVDRITNGAGSMPAFSGVLSASEIDAVARHVIAFRPAPATTTSTTTTSTTTTSTTTTSTTTTSTTTTSTTTTSTTTTTTTTRPPATSTTIDVATSTSASPTTATSLVPTTQPQLDGAASEGANVSPDADLARGPLVAALLITGLAVLIGAGVMLSRGRRG